jgi:drug/metabolite transporter (DMT)-like permease
MRLKADLTLLLVSIIWGTAFVAQQMAGQVGSVYLFNGARFLLAALVVLPFALRAERAADSRPGLGPAKWHWMAVSGVVLFAAAAFQQAGLLHTTAGHAGFITSLYVVFVPVFLFVFWREKPHWLVALAVGLAVAGAFLLSSGGVSLALQAGDPLELLGAFLWSIHVILLGKVASRYEPLAFSVGQFVICGLLNMAMGLILERPDRLAIFALIAPVLFTALFSVGMGYTLQVWAQRFTPPADAALILSLESVFAALAGWLVLREILSPIQIFGCILIFAAVLFSQAKPRVYV